MITDIKGKIEQLSPGSDGAMDYLRMTKLGQILTADWKTNLLLQGKLWRVSVGSITAGGDVAPITGGGNGLTVDQDQPEAAIGVDAGYFLIPVEVICACQCDFDADGEEASIVLVTDRAAGVPTSVTGTIETPANLLDGGAAFPGRAFSAITADITDPTVSEVLDFETAQASDFIVDATAAAGAAALLGKLKMVYRPEVPSLVAGPCGLYLYFGGTAAVTGIASIVVGAVPSDWLS